MSEDGSSGRLHRGFAYQAIIVPKEGLEPRPGGMDFKSTLWFAEECRLVTRNVVLPRRHVVHGTVLFGCRSPIQAYGGGRLAKCGRWIQVFT